uniref:Uncharacterized protein n=1 Tax=Rhizophora mucronata TaxID=61149 RepID=A0A2P2QCX8_RHIMU
MLVGAALLQHVLHIDECFFALV